MSEPDAPRPDGTDPASPWRPDTFDRWLAALDITDGDLAGDDAEPVTGAAPGASPADGSDGPSPTGAVPDPWADLELDPVDLSVDQREYLAWHDHQPPVPRLRGSLEDPATEPAHDATSGD